MTQTKFKLGQKVEIVKCGACEGIGRIRDNNYDYERCWGCDGAGVIKLKLIKPIKKEKSFTQSFLETYLKKLTKDKNVQVSARGFIESLKTV